ISNIKFNDWDQIEKATGLKLEAIKVTLRHEAKYNMFQWDDKTKQEQKNKLEKDELEKDKLEEDELEENESESSEKINFESEDNFD
ncbi:12074_t:CDS:2, partial [Racocetra fulgida]